MTTSRQPWTIETQPVGGKSWFKGADGVVIGVFESWQDAELILESLSYKAKIEELTDALNDAEEDLATEKSKYEQLSTIVQHAQDELLKADICH